MMRLVLVLVGLNDNIWLDITRCRSCDPAALDTGHADPARNRPERGHGRLAGKVASVRLSCRTEHGRGYLRYRLFYHLLIPMLVFLLD